MLLTQTITIAIERGQAFEDENPETHEKEFIQTDFDVKIAEFGELVEKEGGQVVNVNISTTPQHLIAFISYADKTLMEQAKRQAAIMQGVPNLKLV